MQEEPKSKEDKTPLIYGPYAFYNQHGARLCHAVGCRKHKRCKEAFRGYFCNKHIRELTVIRQYLVEAKLSGNLVSEQLWRQKELEFRKFFHEGHMTRLHFLENSNPRLDP